MKIHRKIAEKTIPALTSLALYLTAFTLWNNALPYISQVSLKGILLFTASTVVTVLAVLSLEALRD